MQERQSYVNMCNDNYDDWQINWFVSIFNSLVFHSTRQKMYISLEVSKDQ